MSNQSFLSNFDSISRSGSGSEDEEYSPVNIINDENPNCTIVHRLMKPFFGQRTAAKRAMELAHQDLTHSNASIPVSVLCVHNCFLQSFFF